MSGRDTEMSLEEFRAYWTKNRKTIISAKAFDSSSRRWIEGEEIFRTHGAYTMIVLQFRSRSFLRIKVKPSLKVSYAPEKYANAGTWSRIGIYLTYDEKEYLESLGNDEVSLDELITIVASSQFPGRDALADKLRRASDRMRH